MHITESEKLILENIALNDYTPFNGGEPEHYTECHTWSNCVDCGPNRIIAISIPGIVSSLSKKELLVSDAGIVCLTQSGFDEFQKLPSYFVKFPDEKVKTGIRTQKLLSWFPELHDLIHHFGELITLKMNGKDDIGQITIQRKGR